jgi:hypothetical protein
MELDNSDGVSNNSGAFIPLFENRTEASIPDIPASM